MLKNILIIKINNFDEFEICSIKEKKKEKKPEKLISILSLLLWLISTSVLQDNDLNNEKHYFSLSYFQISWITFGKANLQLEL